MQVKSTAECSTGAICKLLTCIKRLLVLKTYSFVFFEWPLKTGFTVNYVTVYPEDYLKHPRLSLSTSLLKMGTTFKGKNMLLEGG